MANPVLPPGGDIQRRAHVVVTSRNSGLDACTTSNLGAAINIDVSGDTNLATFTVGRNPVHFASLAGVLRAFIADQDDGNVASYSATSFTDITQARLKATVTTLTVPPGSQARPSFVATAGLRVFVAEPPLNQVAVIDSTTSPPANIAQISVGRNPVALVATPDGTKVYSLNQDDNTVTVIFAANNTTTPTPIDLAASGGRMPVWGVASADGTQVFVVNQATSNVSVIDTTADAIVKTIPVGTGPTYAVFQASQRRLYVLSPASKRLSIFDATAGALVQLPIDLTAPPCNAGNPISVTALVDGSRAYVADQATNSVCVLNTTNNTFTKSVPVGIGPIGITSDPDSTRVYTANMESTFGIASISRAGTPSDPNTPNIYTVTVNTSGSTPFSKGQVVTTFGAPDCSFNGQFAITKVDTATQFEYQQFLAQPLQAASAGGTVTNADVSLIQTVTDATVKQNDGVTPLTIPVPGTPTFIAITP